MRHARRGFTLLELMVVVMIVALLVGLLLPVINRMRETGPCGPRCTNNMRQIAAALIDFEGTHNRLPYYGTFARMPADEEDGGVSELDFANPRHSWVVDIPPFLERSDISDNWTYGSPIARTPGVADPSDPGYPNHDADGDRDLSASDNYALSRKYCSVLVCPDDRAGVDLNGNLSYVLNCGFIEPGVEHSWYRTKLDWDGDGEITDQDREYKRMTGVFWAGSLDGKSVEDRPYTFREIQKGDGVSTTIMATENRNAGFAPNAGRAREQIDYDDFTWAYPDVRAVGFGISTDEICGDGSLACPSPYTHPLKQSRINGDTGTKKGRSPYPSSPHKGLVVVSFCDGRTRALTDDLDPRVWFALITPRGQELPENAEAGVFLKEQTLAESDF